MAKRVLQIELWPGPLRPTQQRKSIQATRCINVLDGRPCGNPTENGQWFCYHCKDPDGYVDRLREAQRQARQRMLEAYPVCKHCGQRLSQAQVERGQAAHEQDRGNCLAPIGPLAERR